MEKIRIEVDRLWIYAYHGVLPHERTVGNEFEVSVRLDVEAPLAVQADRLEGTVNYAEVCDCIKEVMAEPSALLEHVCGRLRDALKNRFPQIEGGMVKVAKLNPPIPETKLNYVSVSLIW